MLCPHYFDDQISHTARGLEVDLQGVPVTGGREPRGRRLRMGTLGDRVLQLLGPGVALDDDCQRIDRVARTRK
jgi:hypothetical protein